MYISAIQSFCICSCNMYINIVFFLFFGVLVPWLNVHIQHLAPWPGHQSPLNWLFHSWFFSFWTMHTPIKLYEYSQLSQQRWQFILYYLPFIMPLIELESFNFDTHSESITDRIPGCAFSLRRTPYIGYIDPAVITKYVFTGRSTDYFYDRPVWMPPT